MVVREVVGEIVGENVRGKKKVGVVEDFGSHGRWKKKRLGSN